MVSGASTYTGPIRVGELRPSQLLHTFGVGAVIDLPHLAGMVAGLDDWDLIHAAEISEPRLLAAVRERLGMQVSALRLPPHLPETRDVFDEWARVGVPVIVFPRWLRCPACRYLGPLSAGLFSLRREPYRPDRVRYEHQSCPKRRRAPAALPVRFLLACRNGHLDDFPWVGFAHRGAPCANPILELYELGVTGEASDLRVRCRACGVSGRSLVEAFGVRAKDTLPACRARHPHLGLFEDGCDQEVRTILLGASNLWFAESVSVLSIPEYAEPLAQHVVELWDLLQHVPGPEALAFARRTNPRLRSLSGYSDGEVLAAIEAERAQDSEEEAADVLVEEWRAFTAGEQAPSGEEFRLQVAPVPSVVEDTVAQVVLAERLREVRALVGFTRIDAPGDRRDDDTQTPSAPLSRQATPWVPCAEVRGEGLFLQFDEDAVTRWESRVEGHSRFDLLWKGHARWRERRDLPPEGGFPGLRYLLLHSFAHVLMRQLALEAGYGSASLHERLYAGEDAEEMAGVLLYTAAPDSEGTLGGLVSLGKPERLGPIVGAALASAGLCASDPMCAEHDPQGDASTHGAACHACLFAPETSCERGNRYLDRTVLVDTLAEQGAAFFGSGQPWH